MANNLRVTKAAISNRNTSQLIVLAEVNSKFKD